jgi:branched-chain amino acid transport system substrate-binding protein
MTRVSTFALAVALLLAGSPLVALAQSEGPPIKIGYAISRTGPFAPGAQVTQEPNYLLWAEQVNAAGGLNVKGHKRKIELISSDDRSDVETIVRTYEKLMTVDKVDLILPPWGSTANFAVAPLANKNGYPVLAPTALSMKLVDMKLPYFFSMLPQPYVLMQAAADMLAAKGVKTVAVIYMDDLFGLVSAAHHRSHDSAGSGFKRPHHGGVVGGSEANESLQPNGAGRAVRGIAVANQRVRDR